MNLRNQNTANKADNNPDIYDEFAEFRDVLGSSSHTRTHAFSNTQSVSHTPSQTHTISHTASQTHSLSHSATITHSPSPSLSPSTSLSYGSNNTYYPSHSSQPTDITIPLLATIGAIAAIGGCVLIGVFFNRKALEISKSINHLSLPYSQEFGSYIVKWNFVKMMSFMKVEIDLKAYYSSFIYSLEHSYHLESKMIDQGGSRYTTTERVQTSQGGWTNYGDGKGGIAGSVQSPPTYATQIVTGYTSATYDYYWKARVSHDDAGTMRGYLEGLTGYVCNFGICYNAVASKEIAGGNYNGNAHEGAFFYLSYE